MHPIVGITLSPTTSNRLITAAPRTLCVADRLTIATQLCFFVDRKD